MRRLLGFLSMLLTLHLMLVGSDFVCAKHAVAPVTASHDSHGSSHQQDSASQSQGHEDDACETPTGPDCCSALTSCSTTLAMDSDPTTGDMLSVDRAPVVHAAGSPTSRLTAPETPPPRA